MIKGKMVKIRFRRNFAEQKQWIFLGRVLEFTENWISVNGKGIVVSKGSKDPVDIDGEPRVLMIPRENVAHIRTLPDEFDIEDIQTDIKKFRIYVKVPGAPDTSIGE